MHTVTTRIYDTDDEGRRYLLYRPGDVIADAEAKRVASLVESKPDKPGWVRIMERRKEDLADETPAKPIDHNTNLSDLRAVCAAEGIDPAGANTRADFREAIEAGRAAAGAQTSER